MSGVHSPTTYGTMSTRQDEIERLGIDKDSSQGDNLYLSLNFVACLIFGPVNFVVYKIMYDSYGEGRAFFVSQVRSDVRRWLALRSCSEQIM